MKVTTLTGNFRASTVIPEDYFPRVAYSKVETGFLWWKKSYNAWVVMVPVIHQSTCSHTCEGTNWYGWQAVEICHTKEEALLFADELKELKNEVN